MIGGFSVEQGILWGLVARFEVEIAWRRNKNSKGRINKSPKVVKFYVACSTTKSTCELSTKLQQQILDKQKVKLSQKQNEARTKSRLFLSSIWQGHRLKSPYKTNCTERVLPGIPHYSRDACIIQCLANKTVEMCGCKLVGVPRR